MALNQEMMQSYLQRWEAVSDIEEAERRQLSMTQRWQKTNSILRIALALGLPLNMGEDDNDPIDRSWNRLRFLHIEKTQDSLS